MEITKKREYLAPKLEFIQVTVERGFADSFGEPGHAGDDFGTGGSWDF